MHKHTIQERRSLTACILLAAIAVVSLSILGCGGSSGGSNANSPVGIEAHQGCYANPHAHKAAPCAEGTQVGQHVLTFSVI